MFSKRKIGESVEFVRGRSIVTNNLESSAALLAFLLEAVLLDAFGTLLALYQYDCLDDFSLQAIKPQF